MRRRWLGRPLGVEGDVFADVHGITQVQNKGSSGPLRPRQHCPPPNKMQLYELNLQPQDLQNAEKGF